MGHRSRRVVTAVIFGGGGHGPLDKGDTHLHLYLPGDAGAVRNMQLMSAYPAEDAIDNLTRVLSRGRLCDEGPCE